MAGEDQRRFGDRLAALRAERGWSQETAAQAIGISYRVYQKWERGQVRPRLENEGRIAEAYKITLEQLRGAPMGATRDEIIERLDRLEQMFRAFLATDREDDPREDGSDPRDKP